LRNLAHASGFRVSERSGSGQRDGARRGKEDFPEIALPNLGRLSLGRRELLDQAGRRLARRNGPLDCEFA
jgi:hypothetical protein